MTDPVTAAIAGIVSAVVAAVGAFTVAVRNNRAQEAKNKLEAEAAEVKRKAEAEAAERVRQSDDRKGNLAEYESLNKAMREEIDRIRQDHAEDKRDLQEEIANLRAEVRWLRGDRADQIRRDRTRTHYDHDMVRWLNDWLPRARALGLVVPDPPAAPNLPELIDPDRLENLGDRRGDGS